MFGKEHKKVITGMSLLRDGLSDTEACVIGAMLDSCGIDTYLDYDGEINIRVVAGKSNLPVNIYVREEDFNTAAALLRAPSEGSGDE